MRRQREMQITEINIVFTLVFSLIVAAATIMIALATNKYVKLNASLVEETRLLRKVQTDPRISIYLQPREVDNVLVDLIVTNDSQAQARNLNFRIDPDVYYFKRKKLSDVDFLQHIPSLQPGQRRILPIFTGHLKSIDNAESPIPDVVIISVTYQDVMGNAKEEEFSIPLRSYTHGENWTRDTAIDKIAKSLEALEQAVTAYLQHLRKDESHDT
jgi:hypothetical protein